MKFRDYSNYEVFDDGRIYSYKTKKFLKPQTVKGGYQSVVLYDNEGKMKRYYIHRIVWEAVNGEPIPLCYEINHRNEIKTSNMISNLELLTHKENNNYGTRNSRAGKSISKANTNNPKRSKAVGAFKDDKLVMIFQSTKECGRNGFNQGAVAACCRKCFNRPGNNVYKGFEWRYI